MLLYFYFFFFKQKTAYEMRISDWSSDVCSSDLRTDAAPGADALERVFARRRTLHRLEHACRRMLERHVEIRQHLALGHQRHDVVDVRVRIDVMQTHPRAEFRQPFAKPEHARLVFAVAPLALRVLEIGAVGRGVLREDRKSTRLNSSH